MTLARPDTGLELRSLVTPEAKLELSIVQVPIPPPDPNEVLIRVEAAPINPSDLGLLLAGADLSAGNRRRIIRQSSGHCGSVGRGDEGVGCAGGRIDAGVGNEGACSVIDAGSSPAAQALVGKTVALAGGGMYAQYRAVKASVCPRTGRRHACERRCVFVR